MHLTSLEISQILSGELVGDSNIIITGAAGLEYATATDISFISNPKYLKLQQKTKAGLVLLNFKPENIGTPYILVKNTYLAFAKILSIIDTENKAVVEVGVHKSAVIYNNVSIAPSASIGPNCVIESGASIAANSVIKANVYIGQNVKIGSDCLIYPNTTLRERVVLGNGVIIHSGTVIGSDGFGFVPGATGHFKIPQIGIVEIGDNVEIGANVTIDRATTDKTIIGKGTKIDNLVQIAHNVQIGENCFIVAQSGIAGSAKIGNGVTVAAQAGVVGHITVGNGVTIAARAGVISDVAPGEVVSGFPARPHREVLKSYVILQKLPDIYEKIKKIIKV